jgi:histidine ammonia-lyase
VAIAHGESIALSSAARQRIVTSRRVVDEFADHDDPTYGSNTTVRRRRDIATIVRMIDSGELERARANKVN